MSNTPSRVDHNQPGTPIARLVALTVPMVLALAGFATAASADTTNNATAQPVPFAVFLDGLSTARAGDFVGRPGVALPNEAAFEEIRDHLLRVYGGQQVTRSLLQGGQTFDCIPLAEQPAKRLQQITSIASPPPFSPQKAFGKPATQADAEIGRAAKADKLACPRGSFAMPRMTLEQIARFGSLRAFFDKGPNGAGQVHVPGADVAKPSTNGHAYSYAYQNVDNWADNPRKASMTPMSTALSARYSR
jgi:hypothetical protein